MTLEDILMLIAIACGFAALPLIFAAWGL